MIQIVQGNLLELQEGILVHGCNCHGVMGGGIARQIREVYPEVYRAYREYHVKSGLRLGDVVNVGHQQWWPQHKSVVRHLHEAAVHLPVKLIVANAMTQDDFGADPERVYVDYDAISAAFTRIRMLARDTGLPVHFPQIGCGLARGRWEEVAPRIEAALGPDIDATLWLLPS